VREVVLQNVNKDVSWNLVDFTVIMLSTLAGKSNNINATKSLLDLLVAYLKVINILNSFKVVGFSTVTGLLGTVGELFDHISFSFTTSLYTISLLDTSLHAFNEILNMNLFFASKLL
jgi:hypothetical protein